MEKVLEIRGLTKKYEKFTLEDVSFNVRKGTINGFIGRNGAGKTTTLKSILNLIHSDGGSIKFFGKELMDHEDEIKRRIGFAGGTIDYYKKKKIRDIVKVTRRFFPSWNQEAYEKYTRLFELDETKTPGQLSEGMKVKLNITLALSHGAELLILDEPTSGLDPISRDEMLDIFNMLKENGVSILFSTHITSDLDKCADDITYIRDGHIISTGTKEDFVQAGMAKGAGTNIEEIMIAYEKEARHEKFTI